MSPPDQAPGPIPDAAAVEIWARYAKERYDSAEKRLADFRGWARQLAAGAAVLVGLEAALVSQLPRVQGLPTLALASCLGLVLLGAAYQLWVFGASVHEGYVGQQGIGPESPSVLAEHIRDHASARRMIGAYYSKGYDSLHETAERVARCVGRLARHLARSLWMLFGSLVLMAGVVALSSDERKGMPEDPVAPGTAAPIVTPSGGREPSPPQPTSTPAPSPATSPLLNTPTQGQAETRSGGPPKESLLTTPTPGQWIAEAEPGKR